MPRELSTRKETRTSKHRSATYRSEFHRIHAAIFFIGLLSFGFRLEKTAYRYASVTVTIIVLIPRSNPAWIVGLHRFIEVSVGIIVALAVVAFWPERSPIPTKNAAE